MGIANVTNGALAWNLPSATKCVAMTASKTSGSMKNDYYHKPFIFLLTMNKRKGVTETEKKRQFFDYIVYVAVRVSASNREEAKEIVNDQIIKPYRWPSSIISLSITKIKPIAKQ